MASFEKTIYKQNQVMNLITRALTNYKKLGQAKMTYATTQNRISLLQGNFAMVQDLDAELFAIADDQTKATHPYFVEQHFNTCHNIYEDTLDYMHEVTAKFTPGGAASPTAKPLHGFSYRSNSHLPQLELPSFDGSFAKWETFRDRFKSMIIDDETLSSVERMHYLCSVLSGDASTAVSHLAVTDANFPVAWNIITARYENKRRLISTHLQSLFSLPQISQENSKTLQALRDQANIAIQALQNLGRPVKTWDDILVYLVTQKLDKLSRKAWELKLSDTTEFPAYSELDKFLESRIRALDAILPAVPTGSSDASASKHSKPKTVPSHSATANKISCPICKRNHLLYQCTSFLAYSVSERSDFIKNQKRCFNCLAANHMTRECRSEHRCRSCSQKHHTLLHRQEPAKAPCDETPTKQNSESDIASHVLSTAVSSPKTVILATARIRVYSSQGRFAPARALLDQGSAATLISEKLAQTLRLPRIKQNTRITGIGEAQSFARHATCIHLSAADSDEPAYSTTAIILKSLTKYVPSRGPFIQKWSHIADLSLADNDPMSSDPIDIIIGADLYGQLILEGVRKGERDEPIAQQTVLGWILSGPVPCVHSTDSVHSHHTTILEDLDLHLQRFWEVEDIPDHTLMSPEDQKCEDHFLATHSRNTEGRYTVRLPFKIDPSINLDDSRSAALSSFHRLERRLARESEEAAAYSDFMNEYENLQHMIKVPASERPIVPHPYFIPHHAVVRSSSNTTRLRVVFNASHRTTNGKSLNDCLAVGPKLQIDLPAVVLKWRQFRYVFTADIAKMYRQILVDPRDVDYQRIFWRSSPSNPVDEYRLLTVTYGTSAAPYLAIRVLHQLASDEGSQFPLALPVLLKQTYVDDCIFGADDADLALQTRDQLTALLSKGGFRLRKWASNNRELLQDIDPADHGLACSKQLQTEESLKVLGLSWHPDQDIFRFHVAAPADSRTTKRAILSTIARFFDPLGWVTPVIITAKILLQQLWALRCDWDDPVPDDIRYRWITVRSQLPFLEKLSLPRWTEYAPNILRSELHGFADASTKAYAAAVYLRVIHPDGSVKISLLTAKSKVAPLKTISVPRLELCAALLLARLLKFTQAALQLPSSECFCWTDATIVLAWLKQPPARWKTFVANRVAKIQGLTPDITWKHIPTHDNPADCASRGLDPQELLAHSLWWTGPPWLMSDPASWPQFSLPVPTNLNLEERVTLVVDTTPSSTLWDLHSRYSSWSKLLRITAFIMRYINRLKSRLDNTKAPAPAPSKPNPLILDLSEIHSAKNFWLTRLQTELFPQELSNLKKSRSVPKQSPIYALIPYLDADGLVRVRGRLQNSDLPEAAKHPIIVKAHPLVTLIIAEIHMKNLHAGPRLILALLRQEFWLLRARATVRSILYSCVRCARERAAVPEQLMGDLPDCRVNRVSRAFTHAGVDYAGPINVRLASGRGHKSHKAYIALFICMTTKAVHLECVSDYSSAAFIAAYHRFVSRRGCPNTLYSDNGTTFHGAERELSDSYRNAVRHPDFANRLITEGVSWRFLPPAAPHFGGLWEAGVRSVKHHLKRCIGAHTLTFEELTTLLCRIEACLNSRPIAATTDNPDDYQALTPGHFLIGTPLVASPEPSVLELQENRLSRWQLIQNLCERFWNVWKQDYVQILQQRPKWRTIQHLAKEGQMVLLRDPNAPPIHWALGRIIACHPGHDGLVRVVTVLTMQSEYKRPITKLCFLPVDINRERETDSSTAGGT